MQIEEKWEREAVITGREGKENEGDREYKKRDEVGWRGAAISSSRYPPKLHKHSSLTKTGPWPSILAKGAHTRAQREHFLARSAVYFWLSLTFTVIPSSGCDPRERWKACSFILGG